MTFELIQSVSSETSVRTVLRVQQDPESRELRRDRVSSRGRYRVGVFFGIRLECCRLPVSVQQRERCDPWPEGGSMGTAPCGLSRTSITTEKP